MSIEAGMLMNAPAGAFQERMSMKGDRGKPIA
jgi:hypothetical protein